MKNNVLEYRGYYASVEYSAEDKALIGEVIGVNDTLCFDCDSAEKVEEEFHGLIDDYLETCKRVGKEPDKSYKGSFNVRISPELHREAAMKAFSERISLNEFVADSIQKNVCGYVTTKNQFDKVFHEYQAMMKNVVIQAPRSMMSYAYGSPYTSATHVLIGRQANWN